MKRLVVEKKLLLTATPLQNSLMELYGLSTLLDEHLFGDKKSFEKKFSRGQNIDELKNRLSTFVKRTLRKNVLEYIRYTERKTITQEFIPNDDEHHLYEQISEFLRQESSYILSKNNKHLIILVLRKLLASSPQAVLGTLRTIHTRLVGLLNGEKDKQSSNNLFKDEIQSSLGSDIEDILENNEDEILKQPENQYILLNEIRQIEHFIKMAEHLKQDSKSLALLKALQLGFVEMNKLGAEQKAIIFTESTRTQQYLFDFLQANGYKDQVVMFSGSNTHQQAIEIYHQWLEKYKDTDQISGSIDIDKRTALINYFQKNENGKILIATEAASEGVNLQFCSLLINYDLPWNPQRVEQRIGRCHRYGQKFDVVVINFLNKRNIADQRVLQLLTEKFQLFQGVFGASDEILGQIESGINIEKQIAEIYSNCRTEEQIQQAFDELQTRFSNEIDNRLKETQTALTNHFDYDVLERLKIQAENRLNQIEWWFWQISYFILKDQAEFNQKEWYFILKYSPKENISLGRYLLPHKKRPYTIQGYEHRLNQPLGDWCIQQALLVATPDVRLCFNYTDHHQKISLLECYRGKSGWLKLDKIKVHSDVEIQERLVFTVCDQQDHILDDEFAEKLFLLSANLQEMKHSIPPQFIKINQQHLVNEKNQIQKQCDQLLKEEILRIESWAEDKQFIAEEQITDLKEQQKVVKRQIELCNDSLEQIELQEKQNQLAKELRKARRILNDIEEEIEQKRDDLIAQLKNRLKQNVSNEQLFLIEWEIV